MPRSVTRAPMGGTRRLSSAASPASFCRPTASIFAAVEQWVDRRIIKLHSGRLIVAETNVTPQPPARGLVGSTAGIGATARAFMPSGATGIGLASALTTGASGLGGTKAEGTRGIPGRWKYDA